MAQKSTSSNNPTLRTLYQNYSSSSSHSRSGGAYNSSSSGKYVTSASRRAVARQINATKRDHIPRNVSLTALKNLPPLLCACCTCCNCCWICVLCYNKRNWQTLQQGCIFGAVILIGWGTVRCCFNLFEAQESNATDLSINEALTLKESYNASVLADVLVEPSWAVLGVLFEYSYNGTFFVEVPPSTFPLKGVFYAPAALKIVCELAPGVLLLIGAIRINKTLLRIFLMLMVAGISIASVQYFIVLIYLVAFPLRTTYQNCESGKDCYIGPLILIAISFHFAIVVGVRIHIFIAGYSLTKQIQISVLEKVPTKDENVPLSLNDPYAFLTEKDVPRTSILVPKDIVKPNDNKDKDNNKDSNGSKRDLKSLRKSMRRPPGGNSRPPGGNSRKVAVRSPGKSPGKAAGKGGRWKR